MRHKFNYCSFFYSASDHINWTYRNKAARMHGMAHSNLFPSVPNHHILSSMYYPYHQTHGKEAYNPFGVYLDATTTEGFILPSTPDLTWHHSQSPRVRLLPACAQKVSTSDNYEMSKKHFTSNFKIGHAENLGFQACNSMVAGEKMHNTYANLELDHLDRGTFKMTNSIEARDKSQKFFGLSHEETPRYQLVRGIETLEKSQHGFRQSSEKIFTCPAGEPCDASFRLRTSCLQKSEIRDVHSVESHVKLTKDSTFLPFPSKAGKVSNHLPVSQSPVPISNPSETLKERETENEKVGTHACSAARDPTTKDVSTKQNHCGKFLKFISPLLSPSSYSPSIGPTICMHACMQ